MCSFSQNSRVAVNEPPSSFANLRIINAGVCPISAFGLGLKAEIPAMQVETFFFVFATLETRRDLGRVNYLKDFWETRPT